MVTSPFAAEIVLTGKVIELALGPKNTDGGTVARAGLLDLSVTVRPTRPVGPDRARVAVTVVPPVVVGTESERELKLAGSSVITTDR